MKIPLVKQTYMVIVVLIALIVSITHGAFGSTIILSVCLVLALLWSYAIVRHNRKIQAESDADERLVGQGKPPIY